jgi:hypothetical protein
MTTFYLIELIQFLLGAVIIGLNYFLIAHHRRFLLDYVFKSEPAAEKSFIGLTSIIYFLIFLPILFFGLNLIPPAHYDVSKHIQHTIYFEAGLVFAIGALHFFFMAISSKIKF